MESTQLVEFKTEDEDGKSVTKIKRKVQLKAAKKLAKNQRLLEKGSLGNFLEDAFTATLIDATTVAFEPFKQGPLWEPQPIYPADLNLDSPLAIFSLF